MSQKLNLFIFTHAPKQTLPQVFTFTFAFAVVTVNDKQTKQSKERVGVKFKEDVYA